MTSALPATARVKGTPAAPAAHRAARGVSRPRRALLHTPGKLWALLIGLVLLSLAWGTLGGWVATRHSSAADSVGSVNEQLSLHARNMYQSIADADATITAAFLASPTPPLTQLQRYESDLGAAHHDLSTPQTSDGSQAVAAALARLGGGLSAYSGYVGEATAEYAMGFTLTGGQGPSPIAAASRDATAWYAANTQVYKLGTQANYAGERNLVVGSTAGSTLTGYHALEEDFSHAIQADQAVFSSAAAEGASALDPLTGVVVAASLLMAAGCAWAVSRRLAEYR